MAPVDTHDAPLQALAQSSQQHESTTRSQVPSFIQVSTSFFSKCSAKLRAAIAILVFTVICLLFGRLLFILIGVIGGVLLHAWWEELNEYPGLNKDDEAKRRRRKLGIEIAETVLGLGKFSTAPLPNGEVKSGSSELPFGELNPTTAAALENLVDVVINDYVRWWYEPLLPCEKGFPNACRNSLLRFLSSATTHLSRKRLADIFVQFVMNSSSVLIVLLSELSVALGPLNASCAPVPNAINAYLEEYPESGLSSILSAEQQREKLHIMATELLKNFLETKAYECEPVQIFLREIVTGIGFESILKACSDSEYINNWIIYLFENGEPELLNVIDAGLDSMGQADSNQRGRAFSETFQDLEASEIKADNEAPPIQGDYQSGANGVQSGPKTTTYPTAVENMAGFRTRSLNGISNSDERLDERESCTGPVGVPLHPPSRSIVSSATNNDGEACPHTLKPHDINRGEDVAKSQSSLDGCQFSRFPYGDLSGREAGALRPDEAAAPAPMTTARFHNASVSILGDGSPVEDVILRSKPTCEYLLQIELQGANLTGWMVTRKHTDFESLHEILRRISVISGATGFAQQHAHLPDWRNRTTHDLHGLLEQYLRDALRYECLSECEGIKQFLEKDLATAEPRAGRAKAAFPFRNSAVFENMGKGVLGVISTAPKGVAEGGKAVFGGVSNLFTTSAGGTKKPPFSRSRSGSRGSTPHPPRFEKSEFAYHRASPSDLDGNSRESQASFGTARRSVNAEPLFRSTSLRNEVDAVLNPARDTDSIENPKPSHANDFAPCMLPEELVDSIEDSQLRKQILETDAAPKRDLPSVTGNSISERSSKINNTPPERHPLGQSSQALTDEDVMMIVELLFAVVNEIYSLSSAWSFRKRLLAAAKSFLLRPGTTNIETIRQFIQGSVLEKHSSPESLANYINKMCESCFTGEVHETAPKDPTTRDIERSKLRARARSMFIENGMPPALVSCMGSNATGEALGRIFDSLQMASVSRGLVCALLLQALKVIIQ